MLPPNLLEKSTNVYLFYRNFIVKPLVYFNNFMICFLFLHEALPEMNNLGKILENLYQNDRLA